MSHPITSYVPGQDETPGPFDMDETAILSVPDELALEAAYYASVNKRDPDADFVRWAQSLDAAYDKSNPDR